MTLRAIGLAVAILVPASTWTGAPALAGRSPEVRKESFRLLNEGVSAYNRGEYSDAVDKLETCTAMALTSFRAHFYLGLASNASRRYEGAIRALEIALDLDPNHLPSLIALGDARLMLGDVDEARAAYFRALKKRPGFADALDGVARAYESQSKHDEAIEHYRQAILANRGFAPAYTHLGNLYLRLDRMEEAIRLLEEAVAIRPDYAPGLNRLSAGYGRLKLANQAAATIGRAIELEPDNPLHLQTLGLLLLEQGLTGRSETVFQQALEIDAELPDTRAGLAEIARRRGDYPAALDQIDAALTSSRARGALAVRLRELRETVVLEQSRAAELERAIADGQASEEDFDEMAGLLAGRGQWPRAAELQRRGPAGPERDDRLAYMLFRTGNYREAQELYAKLAAPPGRLDARLNEGVSLARLGDDQGALRAFDAVLDVDRDHALARLYSGNALLRLGRPEAAVEQYRAFLDRRPRSDVAEQVRRILRQLAPAALADDADSEVPLPPPPPPPPPRIPPGDDDPASAGSS